MSKNFQKSALAQRGLSMISMLLLAAIIGLTLIVAAKVVPTVVEYQSIRKAAKKASVDGTNEAEVRRSFEAAATVDYFESVTPQDLYIEGRGDNMTVGFAYDKEIVLYGPVSLLIHYEGEFVNGR